MRTNPEAAGRAQPLDIARIIQLAHVANPANWSRRMELEYADAMREFLLLMRAREIPFVVVGGIALLQYVNGRNTEDLDIIVAAPHLDEIPELKVLERNPMFAKAEFKVLRVDILFYEHPLFNRVARDFSTELQYSVGPLKSATIEGLILLKLFALPSLYRQFDLDRVAIYEADLAQLVARTSREDSFFLGILAEFQSPSDVGEIRSILAEIRQKIRRIQGASRQDEGNDPNATEK
jgi:hypothetical protein